MNRSEFEELRRLLEENGIDRLYHVTDVTNWTSIKENNGLRSVNSLANRAVEIHGGCGDHVSRSADKARSLSDYVHLSFSPKAPWLEAALEAEFLSDPLVLEISLDVLLDEDTLFATGSPNVHSTQIGGDLETFKKIRIDLIGKDAKEISSPDERAALQSEVLVKRFVPLDSVLNRNEIENHIAGVRLGDAFHRSAIIFLIDQSLSMGRSFVLGGKSRDSIADSTSEMMDDLITKVIVAGAKDTSKLNAYDLAVIGYGENCGDSWAYGIPFNGFVSVEQLYDYYIKNCSFPGSPFRWTDARSDSFNTDMGPAFIYVKRMVHQWMDKNGRESIPPTIVHFTDANKIGMQTKGTIQTAKDILATETRNGVAQVWNIQFRPEDSHPVVLPTEEDTGRLDAHGHFLFQMSGKIRVADKPEIAQFLPDWAEDRPETERRTLLVNPSDLSILSCLWGV